MKDRQNVCVMYRLLSAKLNRAETIILLDIIDVNFWRLSNDYE